MYIYTSIYLHMNPLTLSLTFLYADDIVKIAAKKNIAVTNDKSFLCCGKFRGGFCDLTKWGQ
jgi:hypothetical protein